MVARLDGDKPGTRPEGGDLSGPDRSAAARRVVNWLIAGERHVHLSGPPGYGKREVVAAIVVMLGPRAIVVDFSDASNQGNDALSTLVHRLAGHSGGDGEQTSNWDDAWQRIADALYASARDMPVLILEGAEHLFMDHPDRGWPDGLLDRLAIVTVSLAPLHLIFPAVPNTRASEITVQLKAFPAAKSGGGDYEEVERWNPQDRDEYAEEGKQWMRRFVEARSCSEEQRRSLNQVFELKYENGLDELWGGHPLINMALLHEMLEARLAGNRVREVVDRFRLDIHKNGREMFGARLIPFVPGAAESVALQAIQTIAEATEALATRRPLDDRQAAWLFAAGLAQPGPTGGLPVWTDVVTLIADPAGGEGLDEIARWAQRTAISARHALGLRTEGRLRDDRTFRRALVDVEAMFCESEMGIERNQRVDLSRSRHVVENQIYVFRLTCDSEIGTGRGEEKGRAKTPVERDILVFETQGDGPRYWRHHIRTLSMLGRMRHPALLSFSRGGELADPSGASGPEQRSFIEIEHRVRPLESDLDGIIRRLQMAADVRDRIRPNPIYEQIALLAEALDLIHAQGIVHRGLDFTALALGTSTNDLQLVLIGFEHSASLRSTIHKRERVNFGHIRRAIWNLACRAPESLGQSPRELDPSVDVYAFGALAIMLATGLPESALLNRADALIPIQRQAVDSNGSAAELRGIEAASAMLTNELLREDRWAAQSRDLERLKSLLHRCLDIEPAKRPTSEDLALQLQQWHSEYLGSFEREGETLHVSYPHDQMARMLRQLKLVDEDRRLDNAEGRAWLRNKIQEWVDAARWMHFREGGFPRRGEIEADQTRREAQFLLAGPDVVFFASVFREHAEARPDDNCLWLAFAIRREEVQLADPLDVDQHNPRATTEETTWIAKPLNVRVLERDQIGNTPAKHSWTATLDELRRKGRLDEQSRLGREATAVWRLHRDILFAHDAIANFPVTFEKAAGGDPNSYLMKLDESRFRRINEGGRQGFLRQAILERRNPAGYFVDTVRRRIEDAGGGSQFLVFPRDTQRRTTGLVAAASPQIQDDTVEVQFEDLNGTRVPTEAQIVWFDSFGTATAAVRQSDAIDRIERRTWLLDYLVSPRDCGTLQRSASPSCGRMLADAPNAGVDELKSRVETMLSSDPLHAVQGPPGTGKTTLISALVAEIARSHDGSRMLVTSQSHAATDKVLQSVAQGLDAVARHDDERAGSGETIVRLFSDSSRDSVDSEVRKRYSIDAQVRAALRRMKESAESIEPGQPDCLGRARDHLERASKNGYLEMRFKIERTAPLVFSTTGSAMTSIDHLRRGSIGFDYVLIDEAAKAWAIDLVQPLAIADRAILVGDQNQLPPFGDTELERILETARRRRGVDRIPPDVDFLLDMTAKDGEPPFVRMKGWLKLFHRLFEKCPPPSRFSDNRRRIPLTQSLNRQFRSVAAIGTLVSKTFYRDTVDIENSGPAPDLTKRLEFGLRNRDKAFAPAIVWVDTGRLTATKYYSRFAGATTLRNDGEARLIAQLLKQLDLSSMVISDVDPIERVRLLSPYKAQVSNFRRAFRDEKTSLGLADEDLLRLFQTVDASQGSEADIVAVSLCRRLEKVTDVKPGAAVLGGDQERVLKQRVDTILGFLQLPERLNVMCSRARHQLILVGDFEYFRAGAAAMDAWFSHINQNGKTKSFWTELLSAFEDFDDSLHLSGEGQERAVRLPAESIAVVHT